MHMKEILMVILRGALQCATAGLLLGLLPVARAAPEVPAAAFPGAVGWAASTPGGRGGEIVRVTNLRPEGPGSLRAALAHEGPRIVVFEVGGVIDLERQTLRIEAPFATVAGQTAPSPGITLIRGGLDVATRLRHIPDEREE